VHGQRGPGRHPRPVRRAQQERSERAHLALQLPVGVLRPLALEGVGADELAQVLRLVGRGLPHGPHLQQPDPEPPLRELRRGFTPREPAPDDGDVDRHFSPLPAVLRPPFFAAFFRDALVPSGFFLVAALPPAFFFGALFDAAPRLRAPRLPPPRAAFSSSSWTAVFRSTSS